MKVKTVRTHLRLESLGLHLRRRIHIQRDHPGPLFQKGTGMPATTEGRVIHRAARSGLDHAQGRFQKNRDVLHALGGGAQPEDFPANRAPETDDFVGVPFGKFDHSVAFDSSGTISATGKAASEFSPHHLLPVHILPPGTPGPSRWNVPPGRVRRNQLRRSVAFPPPKFRRSFQHLAHHRPSFCRRWVSVS